MNLKKNKIFWMHLMIFLGTILIIFFSEKKNFFLVEICSLIIIITTFGLILFMVKENRILNILVHHSEKLSKGLYETKKNVSINSHSIFKEISENLYLIASRVENLEKQKDSFIYDVSHELRTPISTMKIMSESLLYSNSSNIEDYKDFFKDVVNEAQRMDFIIADLIDSVDLEPSNYIAKFKLTYLNYLCLKVIERMNPIANQKNISLEFHQNASIQIMLDASKIERVLINLIENSVKYSPASSKINITVFEEGQYAGISVEDKGNGIPLSDLGQIFDRFYRVDKDRSRSTGGSGLGLYITKNIVEMHQGKISVESIEGEGSIFTIRLPKHLQGS